MNLKDKLGKAYGGGTRNESGARNVTGAKKEGGEEKPRNLVAPEPQASGTKPKAHKAATESKPSAGLIKVTSRERSVRKVAKFFILIGKDEAAAVMRHLDEAELEDIAREMSTIDRIEPVEAEAILAEFGRLAEEGVKARGGPEAAREILVSAFGSERGEKILLKSGVAARKPFDYLSDFDATQIRFLLKDESPQVLALVMPHLPPKTASSFITSLDPARQTDLVRRLARMEKVAPEVLATVEEIIYEKTRNLGSKDDGERIDGVATLAGILKHLGPADEERFLSLLDDGDSGLGEAVREKLFTVADLLKVSPRDMQKALAERDVAFIATFLKGKDDALRERVLANVSRERRAMILDEMEVLGARRREEVDEATADFVAWFKRKRDSGDLVIEGDEGLVR